MNNKNRKSPIKTKSSKDYQPFVKVADISSLGRSHRVFGHKTKRTHHLLSDLELAVFLLFEWHSNTEDIQEQFPLDIDVTKQIADSEPPRDCRRLNILREYDNEKTNLHS